jgi:signal transduction histidine kinase
VRISQQNGGLLVEVADNGKARHSGSGSGHGIAGMTERAKVLGGTLHAGPRPGGGWRLRATIPLPELASA